MAQQELKRLLGKGFSIATCVGLIIGLGIMRTPGEIAATVSNPWMYLGLWAAGGAFVLLTVLTVAELFSMTPRSGGVYALVRHAYGPYPGFLIGWTDWMASAGAGALKAVVAVEYAALLWPELALHVTPIALVITSAFAALQLGGVRFGARFQQTAVVGFGFIMMGLTLALFYGYLSQGTASPLPALAGGSVSSVANYGLVAAAIIFTYDGWFAPTYFAGEMKAGPRATAEGAIRGVLIIIVFYLSLNLALVLAVPLQSLVGHDLALAGAMEMVYGDGVGKFVIFSALFILLAHQNQQYMNASRTLYALSVDGFGADRAASVGDRGNPTVAVFFTWISMVSLILAGGFSLLLSLTTFLLILTYVGVIVGVFHLRRNEPNADRPYRALGFPWVSGIVLLGWIGIAMFLGFTNVKSVLFAIGLVAISMPAYWWLKRIHQNKVSMN